MTQIIGTMMAAIVDEDMDWVLWVGGWVVASAYWHVCPE